MDTPGGTLGIEEVPVAGPGYATPLRIGVVGVGYWGPNLVRNFAALSGCRVTGVGDLSEGRLEHMRELYPNMHISLDPDTVIEDEEGDAVVIATPVRYHYDLARRSLLANKHVLIEKPMASSSAECEELMALAEARGLTLMVGHTFIYSPFVRRIKKIVDTGELGEILYISSRRLNLGLFQNDINVAWDLAPHDLSIILYLLDRTPAMVHCHGRTLSGHDVEVMTNMSLHFEEGGFATIQSSWIDPVKVRELTVVGDRKMVVYDDTAQNEKVRVYDKRVEVPPHYDSFAEWQFSYHYGGMHAPFIKQVEPLRTECQHFLDCIRTRARPASGGQEGTEVVRILEAASESLARGGVGVELRR